MARKAPSLFPEISDELRIIAPEVIAQENEFLDGEWRAIKQQIKELAVHCTHFSEERKRGWRPVNDIVVECLNCHTSEGVGEKRCSHCGQKFKWKAA